MNVSLKEGWLIDRTLDDYRSRATGQIGATVISEVWVKISFHKKFSELFNLLFSAAILRCMIMDEA